jgi:hypothetical protein
MTPIRKGSNPVKIPFAIKSSDPIFAAWANETRTAIRQLEARMPTANIGRGTGAGSKPPLWVTISAVPESSPVSYQAKVTTGYLCYQNATLTDSDSGVVGYLTPKITTADGELVSIESTGEADWVAPALPLDGLVNYIYLRVQTDSDGAPKEPTAPEFPGDPGASDGPTIVTFTEPQQSTHHVRDSPTSGEEDGDYYLLICETESNEAATPAPRVVRRITGNRELPNQLVEITNIEEDNEDGEVRELYEGYEVGPEDKHQFRTLVQIEGEGEPVIKPMEDPDDPPRSVRFRRVKPNESQGPQVNVSSQDDGDTIQVEGNGVFISYRDAFGGGLEFTDGLVTTKIEPETGVVGDNFNIELLNVKISETGGEIFVSSIGWGTDPRLFYVRNGLLYLNDDGANVPIYDMISRIEGESNPESNQSGPGLTPAA